MIYILRVTHSVQHDLKDNLTKKFLRYASEIITKRSVDIIAEESNEDVCRRKWKIEESLLSELAKERKIEHLYIEPNLEVRKNMGVKTPTELEVETGIFFSDSSINSRDKKLFTNLLRSHIDKRENHWLEAIMPHVSKRVLLVCGADHSRTFSLKLLKRNIRHEILRKTFCKRNNTVRVEF